MELITNVERIERELLLQQLNTTQLVADALCMHERFEQQVMRSPDAIALQFEQQQLSYRHLDARANQLARRLRELGVGPDERVAICLRRGMRNIVSLLAVLKAGGAFVPLDAAYPRERLRYMMQDVAPRVVLTESNARGQLDVPDGIAVLELDAPEAGWQSQSEAALNRGITGVSPDNLAYIIYTSGSTGRPKGVMIEHRALSAQISALQQHYRIVRSDRLLQFVASSFDVSLEEIFGALLSGATLVLRTDAWIASPQDFCALCEAHAITVANLPTLFWQQLADAPQAHFTPGLRLIIIGGDSVSAAALERWWQRPGPRPQLCNAYGPTEATINVTVADCQPDAPPRSIGRPLPSAAVYVIDADGALAPVGVEGEIHIGGVQVARGYWNRPELTRERFVPDPFAWQAGARMYRTGDVGKWLPDGTLEFHGRNDHQVKIRGFRIELGEIEAALESADGVKQALVLAREDEPGDKRLVGYVVAADGAAPDAASLRAHVRPLLPEYMVPSAFVMLEAMPLLPSGKVDRRALPAPQRQAYVSRAYEVPVGEVEQQLAEIWKELLRVPQVGRQDNFFELGGHSLLGMRLITQVRERFGVRSSAMTIFRFPTVEQMARSIEQARAEAQTCALPLPPMVARPQGSPAPMALPQRWWWDLTTVDKNRSTRSLSTALRIRGPLDVEALQKSMAALYERHESLRTTLVTRDGVRQQVISRPAHYALERVTLTQPSLEERERAAGAVFTALTDQLLDVGNDALFAAKLVAIAPEDHVLVVAFDHLIADAASMVVALRELFTLYVQHTRAEPLRLPPMPMQYADYATWQEDATEAWTAAHGSHWDAHMAGAQRVAMFAASPAPQTTRRGFGAAPFDLDPATTRGLRELIRREHSTLAMSVLTAWVAVASRWAKTSDVVVPFLAMGRPGQEVENTIGCFASPLYLRFEVRPEDTFLDLLARVTEEYATAFEHDDLGRIGAQVPRPEFAHSSCFNWHPKEFHLDPATFLFCVDHSAIDGLPDTLELEPFDAGEPSDVEDDGMVWNDEPSLFLVETEDAVGGLLLYRVERVAASDAEQVTADLVAFAKAMVEAPHTRIASTKI